MELYAILLYVNRLEKSLAFYRDALGLEVVEEEAGHFAELSIGQGLLCLHEGPGQAKPGPKSIVLQLRVPDVDAFATSIAATGFRIVDGPSDRGYGVRQLDLADPDDYRIALVQPLARRR